MAKTKIEEGMIFSSTVFNYEVRMEIIFLDDLNDYVRVELTKKTDNQFRSWGEDWTYNNIKDGFKSGDLKKIKFIGFPKTYKNKQKTTE